MAADTASGPPGNGRALAELNERPAEEAQRLLLECCGSRRWARAMAAGRPFRDAESLHAAADAVWTTLGEEDWLEAFAAHPRIGKRASAAGARQRHARWSEQEQSGTAAAAPGVLDALAEANRSYEERFGHVFLICATGRSAEEMLAALRTRMEHDAATELRVAAEEQRRIMHLRLEKLLRS